MSASLAPRLIAAAFAGVLALSACHKGPAEKAGENIDNAIDKMTKGHEQPLQKGPVQQMGESMDKATGN